MEEEQDRTINLRELECGFVCIYEKFKDAKMHKMYGICKNV